TPSTTAIEIAGTTVSCVSPQGRDSEARCDMRRKFFFVAEEHTGNDSRALMPNEHLTAGDVGRVAREPCAFRVVQASMECGRMRARRGGVLADKSRRDANPAGVSLQRATRPLRPYRTLGASILGRSIPRPSIPAHPNPGDASPPSCAPVSLMRRAVSPVAIVAVTPAVAVAVAIGAIRIRARVVVA